VEQDDPQPNVSRDQSWNSKLKEPEKKPSVPERGHRFVGNKKSFPIF
jgi:hypothetical protein